MSVQSLTFNIIPFSFPSEGQTFYFSLVDTERCSRIHRSLFPNNIETIFPGVKSDGTEFIYTTFTFPKYNFTPLAIDFTTENQDLLRRYYNGEIYHFFNSTKKQMVRRGYIGQNQVWVRSNKLSDTQFTIYQKFSLKIQFCNVSNHPELLLSYDGKARVLTTNLATLVKKVSPSKFNWVIKENRLYQYEDLLKHERPGFTKSFPVLNFDLGNALQMEPAENPRENRYKNYKALIETFYDYFLNKPDFKEVLPLHDTGFYAADNTAVFQVSDESNNLAYETPNKGRTPKREFRYKKPFKRCDYKNVHLFFIYHKDDLQTKDKLQHYLENGLEHYPGLTEYAGILFHVDEAKEICFEDRSNPLPEIEAFLEVNSYNEDNVKYLAIYLTPFSKEETRKQSVRVYVRVKEMLLKRYIACQFVEPETVEVPNNNFKWSLTNMSVAILAKLGGIPWKLSQDPKNELVVGIGAFRHPDGVQYLSSAFSFDDTGHFNEFDYFMKNETEELAGKISAKVKDFAKSHGTPKRLVIHFYKERMSEEEIAPIETALLELQTSNPVPIFIIHVNKTEAKDIIAYDIDWKGYWMPYSGTYTPIGNKKYLLFNNSRYPGEKFNAMDGYPFPIKLSIDCTDIKQLENEQIIKELINQVYQFSRMYFKSLIQQNLPVTVKYPEIIAELAPYMDGSSLPDNTKNNLWFL